MRVRIKHEGNEAHGDEFFKGKSGVGKSDINSVGVCAEVDIVSVRRFTMWGKSDELWSGLDRT